MWEYDDATRIERIALALVYGSVVKGTDMQASPCPTRPNS
jgi:hypothetical protein